jgi:hypothetical protein
MADSSNKIHVPATIWQIPAIKYMFQQQYGRFQQ